MPISPGTRRRSLLLLLWVLACRSSCSADRSRLADQLNRHSVCVRPCLRLAVSSGCQAARARFVRLFLRVAKCSVVRKASLSLLCSLCHERAAQVDEGGLDPMPMAADLTLPHARPTSNTDHPTPAPPLPVPSTGCEPRTCSTFLRGRRPSPYHLSETGSKKPPPLP